MPGVMSEQTLPRVPGRPFLLALVILLAAYLPTLQTIPNGSSHYYMVDVGETQIVLNAWGTLHATGYPLYVITGNVLVNVLRFLGVSPAAAPAVVSLGWGVAALALMYVLGARLTGRASAAAAVVALFGLTRTVWIHHVVAEIYTFGLAILALLLYLALWPGRIKGRVYWLALVGGIGVAHHRAVALAAPALLSAVWPELSRQPRRNLRRILRLLAVCFPLGALGFLPYAYLPLRAQAGAAWVYGAPGTWDGLLDQFLGVEANRFMGLPASWAALLTTVKAVTTVLVTDLTLPGLLAGLIGLAGALGDSRLRRAATVMLLTAGAAYSFHVLAYTDVLSALILAVTLPLAFGWLFLIDRVMSVVAHQAQGGAATTKYLPWLWLALIAILAAAMVVQNGPFISGLVHDRTGLETIALAQETPTGATLMIGWGTRHFAVGFARDVDPSLAAGRLQAVTLVDHRADFASLVAGGMLVTPAFTFYSFPLDWWEQQIGGPVYLRAAAPELVAIDTKPVIPADPPGEFGVLVEHVVCASDAVILDVTWYTPDVPTQDLSVFVHAWGTDGTLLGQGDQSAPVYGWRPLTSWTAGEAVRDVYRVPVSPADVARLRYGLYRLTEAGFQNLYAYELPVSCTG